MNSESFFISSLLPRFLLCLVTSMFSDDVPPPSSPRSSWTYQKATSHLKNLRLQEESKEGSERKIKIDGVSKVGFTAVWDFIHGTEFSLDGENDAIAILSDSHYLQIERLADIMCKELIELLNPENAFLILTTAESIDREDLRDGVVTFVARTFSEIIQTRDFLDLSLKTLKIFLEKDEVKVSSEQEMYEATRRWIDHDEKRKEFMPELMERVRLPLLPLNYLSTNVLRDPLMYDNPKCLRLVMEAKDFHLPELRQTVPPEKTRVRQVLPRDLWCLGMRNNEKKVFRTIPRKWKWQLEEVIAWPFLEGGSLVAVEGKLVTTDGTELKSWDPYTKGTVWKTEPQLPQELRKKWPSVVAMPGSIIICGCQKSVLQFDMVRATWTQLSSAEFGCDGAAAAFQDSSIHIIGGFEDHLRVQTETQVSSQNTIVGFPVGSSYYSRSRSSYGSSYNSTQSVSLDRHHCLTPLRKYQHLDLRVKKWQVLKDLPAGIAYAAAGFHNEDLYVSGGDGGTDFYVYDAPANAWRTLAPMKDIRQRHSLLSLSGNLFAIGGTGNPSIESFDGNEWKIEERLEMQTCEGACRFPT